MKSRCVFLTLLIALIFTVLPEAWADQGVLTLPRNLSDIEAEAFMNDTSLNRVVVPDGTVSIGERAFAGSSMREIELPRSISYIAEDAFQGAPIRTVTAPSGSYADNWVKDHLKLPHAENPVSDFECSVDLSKGVCTIVKYLNTQDPEPVVPAHIGYFRVTEIRSSAFKQNSFLTAVTLPDTLEIIDDHAFEGCTSLTSIVIPNSITSIGEYTFKGCTSLTSIVIPNSITSIGNHAFEGCTGLTSVTIPDSVRFIDYSAFEDCTGLTSVTIPDSVRFIDYSAFEDCTGLTQVTIPGSISSIGSSTFENCTGLTSVTIPGSVTSIGSYAFSGCTGLVSVTIPNSVTSIGHRAFEDCSDLTSVTIPDSVTSFGSYAFSGCTGLTTVTIPGGITSTGSSTFENCTGLTLISIPDSVTSIGSSAFEGCSGLTSISIPDSVTSIGSSAFEGCSGLTSISIPGSVTSIGSSAFEGCSGLTSISIPDSVTSIGVSAFFGCTGLTELFVGDGITDLAGLGFNTCKALRTVTLGNGITAIPNDLFRDFTLLETVSLGDNITSIGNFAFYGCTGLKSLTIPNTVTSIGNSVFYGCTRLTSLAIPNTVTSIGNSVFYGCTGLAEFSVGDGVTELKHWAWGLNTCKALRTVTLGNGITAIPNNLFKDFTLLETVSLGDNVTSIGYSAFENCTGLRSLAIPNSVTSIGSYAFCGSGLISLAIPDSVTSIGDYAFKNCSALAGFFLGDGVTNLAYLGLDTCKALQVVSVGNGVTAIPDSLFSDCELLEMVWLSDCVRSIGVSAFQNCKKLRGLTIPDGITSIGSYAFSGSGLSAFAFPDSVKTIPHSLFSGCALLETVSLGNGVTSIGSDAFRNCEKLAALTIPDNVTSISSNAFFGCTGLTELYLGDGVTYLANPGLNTCKALRTLFIGNGVKTIPDSLVSGCTQLETVSFGSGLTYIGDSAFSGCSALTKLRIPSNVTSIGAQAFADCASVSDLQLGGGVKTIGREAFRSCESLNSVLIPPSVQRLSARQFANCKNLHVAYVCDSTNVDTDPGLSTDPRLSIARALSAAKSADSDYAFDSCAADFLVERYSGAASPGGVEKPEDEFTITARVDKPILYLGVGQEGGPIIIFSDGLEHYYTPGYASVETGDAVDSTGLRYKGKQLGESVIKQHITMDSFRIWQETESGYKTIRSEQEYTLDTLNSNLTSLVRVTLDMKYDTIEIGKGDYLYIRPSILYDGSDLDLEDVTWSSSDPNVVMVGQSGVSGTIHALERGEAVVTVRQNQTGAECSAKVTVGDAPTEINFKNDSPLELGVGEKEALSVSFPKGQLWHKVEYKIASQSSKTGEAVVSLSEDGVVIAESEGTAVITATAGVVSDSLTVNVKLAPTEIRFVDKNGKDLDEIVLLWGTQTDRPAVKLSPKDAKASITYKVSDASALHIIEESDSAIIKANPRVRRDYQVRVTVRATTHNGKSDTFNVIIPYYPQWNEMLDVEERIPGVEKKLCKKITTLNSRLQTGVKKFDDTKKKMFAEEFDKVVQIASYSTDGPLPSAVSEYLTNLMYQDMKKAKTSLSTCKNEQDLVKAISKIILNGGSSRTFEIGSVKYIYTEKSIGSNILGAGLSMGEIKNNTSGKTWPVMMTYTSGKEINAFMQELKRLADAKIKSAVKEAISDASDAMGLQEIYEYMKTMAEAEDSDYLRIILKGIGSGSEALTDKLTDLITKTQPKVKTLKDYWKDVKDYFKGVLAWVDEDDMKATDPEGLLKKVKMEEFKNFVDTAGSAVGALQEILD